jgi:hypothetical protein
LLRCYESNSQIKYNNATKLQAKAPKKNNDDLTREIKFDLTRKKYKKGNLTLKNYLSEILDLYNFEPKKKYFEKLVDTSEYDSTDVEDDSEDDIREPEPVVVIVQSKVPCNICNKEYTRAGLKTHQAACRRKLLSQN